MFPFDERFFYIKFDKWRYVDIYETMIFCSIILSTIVHDLFSSSILGNVIRFKKEYFLRGNTINHFNKSF